MSERHDNPDSPSRPETGADGELEQVGRILERMELDQAEIVRLRNQTREVLARLAA